MDADYVQNPRWSDSKWPPGSHLEFFVKNAFLAVSRHLGPLLNFFPKYFSALYIHLEHRKIHAGQLTSTFLHLVDSNNNSAVKGIPRSSVSSVFQRHPKALYNIFIRPPRGGTYYGMALSVRPSVRRPSFRPSVVRPSDDIRRNRSTDRNFSQIFLILGSLVGYQ